jgi:hypothetical protein
MRRHFLAIDWIVLASLVVLNLLVIAPFLTMDFSSQPWNNDYTYIGMSRMFRDRPWSWNSLQYGGAPFHYLYPPLFHLIVTALPVRSLGRAYHLVSGVGYALVPAAFYIAALQLFRSRRLAAALAIVQSFSPTVLYYIVPAFAGFAGNYRHGPWNFVALVASNESAHTLSLALVLLVLAAAWRERWMVASLCAAAVFLMNWAGIVGLLMVLTAVAVARSRQLGYLQAALRVAGVAGVGYGLAAFWITPDCIYTTKLLDRVVLRHIQPSTPWNTVTVIVLAGAAILLAISLWPRIHPAAAFVIGAARDIGRGGRLLQRHGQLSSAAPAPLPAGVQRGPRAGDRMPGSRGVEVAPSARSAGAGTERGPGCAVSDLAHGRSSNGVRTRAPPALSKSRTGWLITWDPLAFWLPANWRAR